MKVLSLLQPWASLVVIGQKKVETRSWNTKYRGTLLIHASANNKSKEARGLCESNDWFSACIDCKYNDLPFGKIIGVVDVVDTMRFGDDKSIRYLDSLTSWEKEKEITFGDWNEGRYGWILENPREVVPEAAKGALSLWDWQGRLISKHSQEMFQANEQSLYTISEA